MQVMHNATFSRVGERNIDVLSFLVVWEPSWSIEARLIFGSGKVGGTPPTVNDRASIAHSSGMQLPTRRHHVATAINSQENAKGILVGGWGLGVGDWVRYPACASDPGES